MHHAAKGLASLGRNGDTTLVHMSRDEVAGLQSLAESHGTSLTTNPKTGLPEAFSLKSLLPMIAGAAATFFTGGAAAPWMAALAGGLTGAATGDKNQSLLMRMGLGALGGFGGGSLAAGLAGAGASTAGTAAANTAGTAAANTAGTAAANTAGTAAANAGSKAALQNVGSALAKNSVGGISEVVPTVTRIGGTAVDTLRASGLAGQAAKMAGSNALSGLSSVGSEAGRKAIAQNMFMQSPKLGLAAAAAPVLSSAATPPKMKGSKETLPDYPMYSYNQGKQNPNFGKPGHEGEPPILGQGYSAPQITHQNPFAPTYASYDKKGKPVGAAGLSPLELYMQQQQQQNQQQGMVPEINAAEGGSLDDYMDSINASNMRSSPMEPYKSPYASAPVQTGNRFDGMGSFGGMLGMSGMRGFNTGYGNAAPTYDRSTGKFSYASGGGIESLGAYSDGGRLLKGPGDGVSDDIPATIHRDDGTQQPAKLADGEFVVDAQTVSKLGNGSTEAGARKLYAMMDRIHALKTKPGKDLHAEKYLPA